MANRHHAVFDAIDRWLHGGLIGPDLADRLRAHEEARGKEVSARFGQYALATVGGIMVVLAAATFLSWAWPRLSSAGRAETVAAVGIAVNVFGVWWERRKKSRPVAYLLQTAGLAVLLMGVGFSTEAWSRASAAATVTSIAALTILILSAGRTRGRNAFMAAVHVAFGYAFLYAALIQSTSLDPNTVLWILDGIAAVSAVLLAGRVLAGQGAPGTEWALYSFVVSLYAGLVMVMFTALGPLDLEHEAAWAGDVWLLIAVGLTLWGIHRAPPGLRRGWFERQLALLVMLGMLFGYWTLGGAVDWDLEATSLGVALWGAAAMAYGFRLDLHTVAMAGVMTVVIAAWIFSIDSGGAVGAVLALAFSAVLFFWLAGRFRRVDPGPGPTGGQTD